MQANRQLLPVLVLVFVASTAAAQALPADAMPTCTAPSKLFNSWFQSGSVSLDGVVSPANSISLDTSNNCGFYLWSEQMFLWMTSPATASDGSSGRVFNSNVFYEVTTAQDGKRSFVPHSSLKPGAKKEKNARLVGLRQAKPGPHGLPAVVDRKGNIIEIVPPQLGETRKPLMLNEAGKKVEVAKVAVTPDKRAIFYDAAGTVIPQPKLILSAKLRGARIGQRFFTADNTPIIVDPTGAVLDVSPGQAGSPSGVLLAQNGSVIYYSIVVNDVYAYFASGVNAGKLPVAPFPTTQKELDGIQAYAGQTFTDGNALAIEAKLSWIDAASLPDASTYITATMSVPVYDMSKPYLWTQTGTQEKTLALLGVHIVGSAAGHPEMIWSTFEHVGNAPNGSYQYTNTSNQTVTVPASTAGTWLLSKTDSSGPFNIMHANYDSGAVPSICAAPGTTISPSDTQRVYAFGVAPTGAPNQEDATPAAANTEVISINNSVLGQLMDGDVRKNYYFVGSTWTFGGFAPTGAYSDGAKDPRGAEIGTNFLANSTMETYHQAVGSSPGTNCFSCHNLGNTSSTAPGTPVTTAVSHIFSQLQPLMPATAAKGSATKKKK
jgi:hypothetical protein